MGSFTVSDDKNFYHCFGCGKSGDVFNYLMETENLSFIEALKKLAEQAGINTSKQNFVVDPKLINHFNLLIFLKKIPLFPFLMLQ